MLNTIMFTITEVELLLIVTEILFGVYIKPYFENRKLKKTKEVLKRLENKKAEDDVIIEKEKEMVLIDKFVESVGAFLNKYQKSRSKRISYKDRQILLANAIKIIPVLTKYIKVDYYYDLDDKEWYRLTDKDMIILLEGAYNGYSRDNLESLNSMLSAILRLRDDKR